MNDKSPSLREDLVQKGYLFFVLLAAFLNLAFTAKYVTSPKVLPQVVHATLAAYFSHPVSIDAIASQVEKQLTPPAQFLAKRSGVFVTLSIQGKPRACWGTLHAQQSNLIRETIASTLGALTKEYRYRPIQESEWQKLKLQVTVVKQITPVRSFREINPIKDGLLIRQGGKSGVILPGEAQDAYYQLVLARLKAGISPHDPYQLYRIETDVYL